ncbi:unnamed protein product [Orchesella dallaii]|uniref:Uncharacterized protein n=1 Tax=Orchesella dallaii TaxID=48710 RepID=A0ABP1SA26_9HEXA
MSGGFYAEQLQKVHPDLITMTDILQDAYTTLLSTESVEYFPDNNSTNFTNILSKDHTFDTNYDIGLVSISFNLEEKPQPLQQIVISSEDKITLCIPEVARDTVYINGVVDAILLTEKFLNTLNNTVSLLNSVSFSISYNEKAEIYVKLTVKMANNGYVVLDSTLIEILGFDKTTVANGQHTAVKSFNEGLLETTNHKAENKYINTLKN